MKVSCDIIRDVLPLYAEDMVSDATRDMVDEHLCGCDECTKELAAIKKAPRVPVEADVNSLKRVGNAIRRRKILTVTTAVMLVLAIIVSVTSWLNVKIWLSPEEAVLSVEAQEDGSLIFWLEDYVVGHDGRNWNTENNYHAHCWYTNRYTKLQIWWQDINGIERKPNYYQDNVMKMWEGELGEYESIFDIPEEEFIVVPVAEHNHYYYNVYDCTYDVVLWDAGMPECKMTINGRCDVLEKNFWGAGLLTALFGLCMVLVKKSWIKELAARLTATAGSVVFSTIVLTGGKFVVANVLDEPYDTLRWIYAMSVFIALTALLFLQLQKLNKNDKAI